MFQRVTVNIGDEMPLASVIVKDAGALDVLGQRDGPSHAQHATARGRRERA